MVEKPEQLIFAIEIIVDITHTDAYSLGNVAHRCLGIAVFQKHTLGNLYNLFARIILLCLHGFIIFYFKNADRLHSLPAFHCFI